MLTDAERADHSTAMAVAELLDESDQPPSGWGRYGYVYVIELASAGKSRRPEIYIGDTRKSPEERFRDHITDRRERRSGARTSASCVRTRGTRLAYELFKHLNPLPRGDDACERAKELRRQLEPKYEICGSPDCMESVLKAT